MEHTEHWMHCRPTVFLDRDGVLVEEKSYIASVEELKLFPYAEDCVRQIHQKGYYAIVVTNQSGIARGLFSEAALQEMNVYLQKMTGVDAVYYCPHHPDGKAGQYRKSCSCRKPGTGLLEQACKDFPIDITRSYMVGDRASDVMAGKKAGIRTVLLESGYGTKRLEADVKPDYILEDLRAVITLLK